MDVSVIIVSYHSAAHIRDCLASVQLQEGIQREILVVDNASSDDTVDVVRNLGEGVTLLANRDNLGFGRACNQGFAASHGRFAYFLNPDAQLVQSDALARLVRALEDHPRWGMAGTRILSGEGQIVSPPATSYPGQFHTRNDFARLPGQIAWVLGASMFFRREVFAALGGFDPDFFLHSEETDLCLRLRQQGYEIGLVDDAAVRHIGGASEQRRDPYEVWRQRMDGLHRFWKKHYLSEDAARLVRRDRGRARFRMLWNGGLAWLQPPHSKHWQKHRQYRAIWEASTRFLAKQP